MNKVQLKQFSGLETIRELRNGFWRALLKTPYNISSQRSIFLVLGFLAIVTSILDQLSVS